MARLQYQPTKGSKAIDGIFISSAIQAEIQGGFLPFDKVTVSDHRVGWLDILAYLFEMAQLQDITTCRKMPQMSGPMNCNKIQQVYQGENHKG